jgi:PAS domain S-box-containing protein
MKMMNKLDTLIVFSVVGVLWIIIILFACLMNINQIKKSWLDVLKTEAEALYMKDTMIRKWIAENGGLYMVPSEKLSPNPNLSHVPHRDLTTKEGINLTLVNPAYFLRLNNEYFYNKTGVLIKITSDKLLRKENAPDEWELDKIKQFKEGKTEFYEVTNSGGKKYFRYIKPFITESGCLKCHGIQGYKVGDVRGAISITISTDKYDFLMNKQVKAVFTDHSMLCLAGLIGIIIGYLIVRRYENAMMDDREHLLSIVRSIYDGVIVTDLNGNITMANRRAIEILGYTTEELVGKHIDDVLRFYIHEKIIENPLKKVLSDSTIDESYTPVYINGKDNRSTLVSYTASPINNSKSQMVGALLVFKDETEKYKMIELLEKKQRIEMMSVFAGGVAHDINNLISGIYGYVEVSLLQSDNEKVKEYLEKVKHVLDRAKFLATQLLSLSKDIVPNKTMVNIPEFIKEAIKMPLIGTSVSVDFQIESDNAISMIDKNQISQVIDNLVINAVQAMTRNPALTISVKNVSLKEHEVDNLPGGLYVKISITDNGCGINEESLKEIFEPFFTTKTKGHGLGLFISKKIIEAHCGAITVSSKINHGTTFDIYLPAYTGKEVIEKIQSEDYGSQINMTVKGNAVVMDDEESILDSLSIMLNSMGLEVYKARDGATLMNLLQEIAKNGVKVDLIILDMTIQGGKGALDVIQDIKDLVKDARVIVSSAYISDPVLLNPGQYGFDSSLSKPYRFDELKKLVFNLLSDK